MIYDACTHNHSLFFLVIIVRMSVTPSHPLFIVNARRPLVSLQDYFSPTAFSYVTMRIVSIRCWKFSDLDYAFNNSCYFTFAMYCTLTAPQRTKLNSALYYTLLAHVYLHLPPIIYHKWFPTLFSGTLFCLFFAVLVSRIFYDSLRLSCELYVDSPTLSQNNSLTTPSPPKIFLREIYKINFEESLIAPALDTCWKLTCHLSAQKETEVEK